MEPEVLNLFLQLFIQATDSVAPPYFSTHYNEAAWLIAGTPVEQRQNLRKKQIGGAIVQTGERIFCYELYHQLRVLLDHEDHRKAFQNVYLQGELQKIQILKILEQNELAALSGNFIPDLLLHSPGTAAFHPYVIEVKADRNLSWEQIRDDISKVNEFMTNYHYQRGIFLATAINYDYLIENRIANNPLLADIPNLAENSVNIYIVSRENEYYQASAVKLSDIWEV